MKHRRVAIMILFMAVIAAAVGAGTGSWSAYAHGDDHAMVQGTEVLKRDVAKAGSQRVNYFGWRWNVIGYGKTAENDKAINPTVAKDGRITLMLSTPEGVATSIFHTNILINGVYNGKNEYKISSLKNSVNNLYADFPESDKVAVKGRFLHGGSANYEEEGYDENGMSGTSMSDVKLWPLSSAEAASLDYDLRATDNSWWLRTPGSVYYQAAFVAGGGSVYKSGGDVKEHKGVRPAFDLEQDAVLFLSNFSGGKISDGVGSDALYEVPTVGEYLPYPEYFNDWKVTLKDDGTARDSDGNIIPGLDGHKAFKITEVSQEHNDSVTVKYDKAVAGNKNMISAIIKDRVGKITYYGQIKEVRDNISGSLVSGSATINVKDKLKSGDSLYVFNEKLSTNQSFPEYYADYSSAIIKVADYHDIEKTAAKKATCTEAGNSEYWTCKACNKYYSDEKGEAEIKKDSWIIQPLDHDYIEDPESVLLPTCENEGHEADKKCSRCDSKIPGETIPALDHKWGEWTVTKPATTTEEGEETRTCERDSSHEEKRVIDKLPRKVNPLAVKGKTAKIKYSKLKKKSQKLSVSKVIKITAKGQGTVTYRKSSVTYSKAKSVKMSKKALKKYRKKVARKITVNSKTGKVTLKKGLKKGTYKVKLNVTASGNANYSPVTRTVTFKIRVK